MQSQLSRPASALPLCVLVPAGPGQQELERLADLIDALLAYTALPLVLVVINDNNDADAIRRLGLVHGLSTHVLPNARRGEGDWWCGGLAMAMHDALLWIARNLPCRGVLRIDSDALVINPFALEIVRLLESDSTVGMVGTGDTASGDPSTLENGNTALLYWRSKPFSYDRSGHKLILSLWGWGRRIRLLIGRAARNGQRRCDYCQGGAYALSPEFLRRLAVDPAFQRPRDFLHIDFCEDVLMAMLVYALGLRIHYTVGPGRLFASKWHGLPASPEVLADAGTAIIHSIKHYEGMTEREIRTFFRSIRKSASKPTPPVSNSGVSSDLSSRISEKT